MEDLQFFSEPFSPFSDIDLLQLQAISNQQTYQNANDPNSPSLISSSPPSYQFETLRLYQQTQLYQMEQKCPNFPIGWPNFSLFNALEVKAEESHQAFEPHSYGSTENAVKFMQMSYSSNFFDGNNNKPGFYFQPSFDSLMKSPSFQNQALNLSSPESSFLDGQMRRISSTGDLQIILLSRNLINLRCHLTNLAIYPISIQYLSRIFITYIYIYTLNTRRSSVMEEAAANFKTRKYSAEERKERISKYRAKRPQRNFNKTGCKYACRKTLADNRPRTRGRFARNDETAEILKAACSSKTKMSSGVNEVNFVQVEGFNVEEEEMNATVEGGGIFRSFSRIFGFGPQHD
ncbi:unnamed protein product [Malus baccata var. baccata]